MGAVQITREPLPLLAVNEAIWPMLTVWLAGLQTRELITFETVTEACAEVELLEEVTEAVLVKKVLPDGNWEASDTVALIETVLVNPAVRFPKPTLVKLLPL